MIQRHSRKVAEYVPRFIGGHIRRTGGGIGAFGDPLKVEQANQRASGDVKSGKIDVSGVQEVDRVAIGRVGDRTEDDFNRFVKAADDTAKLRDQLSKEEAETKETQARVDLLRFEEKHGYKTGVRSGGAS